MIIGIKNADDLNIRYDLNNNAVENMLHTAMIELQAHLKRYPLHQWEAQLEWWLKWQWKESCSSESFATILEGIGIITEQPDYMGLHIQAGDYFTNHLNDPKYDQVYSQGLFFDNRSIYNWEKLAKKIGLHTRLIREPGFSEVQKYYRMGRGAMLLFPGHYCAGIGYDAETNENIHHNPNKADSRNKNGGKFERLDHKEWATAEISKALIIWR